MVYGTMMAAPRTATLSWTFLALSLLAGCDRPEAAGAAPGEPLPGLSAAALARFEAGRALFDRDFTEAEGLGPLFNQRRCSACHDLPTIGGAGAELVPKATRWEDGHCDLLEREGGDLLQQRVIDALRVHGMRGERMPPSANATANILPPALYGMGLVDAIPEATLLRLADPDDRNGDGISGRLPRTRDGGPGRFGRKGDHPTLAAFTETAIRLEMGITTPNHPVEETLNGEPIPPELDQAADPEVDAATLSLLADYMRFLALPAREQATGAAADSIAAGERLFDRIGCTSCHVPALTTGPSEHTSLDRRRVPLYSDLLLHDMGPELGSICGLDASPTEWRTPPLAGLRHRPALMHDAGARAHERAILLHGGEAAASRGRFERLPAESKALLMRFLASL